MANFGNVRGTVDTLPADCVANRQIVELLRELFESYGYQPIDVPVIEHTDLFLAKSGEEIISKLYSFSFKNRNICLRPEFTASIGRAFVNHLQGNPLPVRLYYHGPVFRYEKPQKGRYRQFTQVGVELIGATGPLADAEIIHCAISGLERLGLHDYRVVIGDIGVVNELLASFGLDYRAIAFLVQNMENLAKDGKGIEHVKARLKEVYPSAARTEQAVAYEFVEHASWNGEAMFKRFAEMSEEDARAFLRDFLAHMDIDLGMGNREPEEIVERLLRKLRQKDQMARIFDALNFLTELNSLMAPPTEALPKVKALCESYHLKRESLARVEDLMAVLDLYGIDWDKVEINLGMGRGLQYYTGMIFEIYHRSVGSENQLCGGGRYDELIRALGGQHDVPACGFSYGLERLRMAANKWLAPPGVQVLVIAVDEADRAEAIGIARELRSQGVRVETDVRRRGVKGNLQYADRVGIPFCVIIGERERASGTVVVRNMVAQQERTLAQTSLSSLVDEIQDFHRVGQG